jgi:hypothetical protein
LVILYLQRFPDDLIKSRIVLNDLEGFNIPKTILEKIKNLFTKPQITNGIDNNKSSGLDAFFNVALETESSLFELSLRTMKVI